MEAEDGRRVLETLDLLDAAGGFPMDAVYDRLFAIAPETQALFIGDLGRQMRRFETVFRALALSGADTHASGLATLGARHSHAGVQESDHAALCAALVAVIGQRLGRAFTPEREAAWRRLYAAAQAAMRGARPDAPKIALATEAAR